MRWNNAYREKLTSADAALRDVPPDANVYVAGNAATPRELARALVRRSADAPGINVGHVLLVGDNPFAEAHDEGRIHQFSWFVGSADRRAVQEGRADYIPSHLSDIPALLRAVRPRLDVALLMVSPPDKHGFLSVGVEVLASFAAAEAAQRVVVQVNEDMPRVLGNTFLHVDEVDAIVEHTEPLPELQPPTISDVEHRIAEHVAGLIPERATLQLGIGGIPDAVIAQLEGREDLGVHSEMISDGVMHAFERGTIPGLHKTRHRRKIVTTFALGTKALYGWLHENPAVEAHPCDHTNDILVASSNERLVAINSAISVDLTGQINSDSIGGRIYSGVGGQLDFIRAAARSKDGVPIIALPSTARGGQVSRIVRTLEDGAGVVTPRADAHYVVTEFGVAHVWGRSLKQRAEALATVAHPDFRADLVASLG